MLKSYVKRGLSMEPAHLYEHESVVFFFFFITALLYYICENLMPVIFASQATFGKTLVGSSLPEWLRW